MNARFHRFASRASDVTGSPQAFIFAVAAIVVWAASGPFLGWSNTWQLLANTTTTLATTLLVLLVQHSSNTDTRAIQAKLDAIAFGLDAVDNRVVGIDAAGGEDVDEVKADIVSSAHEEYG